MKISRNEFHISKAVRDACGFSKSLYASSGNVIFTNIKTVREAAEKINALCDARSMSEQRISSGSLNAMGLIDEVFHYVCMLYRRDVAPNAFSDALALLDDTYGAASVDELLLAFIDEFPPVAVYNGEISAQEYLAATAHDAGTKRRRTNREQTLEELVLLHLANENPAFKRFAILFDDAALAKNKLYARSWKTLRSYFAPLPPFGPFNHDLIHLLKEPVVFSPESLRGQLEYIITHWAALLGDFLKRLLAALDTISEEEKALWHGGGDADTVPYSYENLMKEYERFSADSDWMPKVVLMAKTVLVWLDQLSKKYARAISRLDEIPDEELDVLRDEGFTALWLIGLWERSNASRRIKQICGNPEAAASAYSLYDYEIAQNIGGWDALINLRTRLWQRGIRLASDMVPNHTGMDAKWVVEKPDVFVQRRDCPFPHYTFNGENLSADGRVGIYLEDHYYSKTDCAVIFKRVDNYTGDVRYIYHGNDGTGLPWNDTAQIYFLNPSARQAVMQQIINVAKNFPIIRFDAAMVLAKKHIRRLWYPEPGHGGDIATRSETGLSTQQFNDAIPNEFWREVVDRIAQEVPDTLLLAEAFWMMEGYFVRTLGMHRVYNSAFMNMLKKEENKKYRDTVKNTLKFDPQVLKRFVNFMNNPDEETAVAQFGRGDKYFGVCTLMVTMPGLPMFGHGQIEGFEEKYGMEYTKAYRNETPDKSLVARHWHDIFPLMKNRWQFAHVENFLFYDVWNEGSVNENVFAYSNDAGGARTLVLYNNKYERASGWIKQSCEYAVKTGSDEKDVHVKTRSISEGLGLNAEDDSYCILYEQRSSLWYVRKSRDICERGMFIALNGFESQVYLHIHQVADTADNKWRILCETLAGRGCPDLQEAWEEIRYKELYEAFGVYMDAALPRLLALLFSDETRGAPRAHRVKKLNEMLTAVHPLALAFYAQARDCAAQEHSPLRASPNAQWEATTAALQTLIASYPPETRTRKTAPNIPLAIQLKKAKTRDAFLALLCTADTTTALLFGCYALIATIAQNGHALTWSLARKFSERLQTVWPADGSARAVLTRLFTLSPLAAVVPEKKDAAYAIASFLIESEAASLVCGVNTFDTIRWFNKELSDVSVQWLFGLLLINKKNDDKNVIILYNKIQRAKENAAYRCDAFIAAFKPKSKRVKTDKISTAHTKDAASLSVKKIAIRRIAQKKQTEEYSMATTAKKTTTAAKKPAAKKTTTAKKTTAKKPAAKKTTTTKKTVAKKPAAKKTTTAKKTVAKKPVAKKTTAKKTTAKKTTAVKKTTAKKPAAKKTTAKKPAAKKAPAKTAAKK